MNIGQRERNNISCLGWPANKGLREFLFRSSAVSFLPVRLYYMYKVPMLLLTMMLCIRLSWTFENHRSGCQFDGNQMTFVRCVAFSRTYCLLVAFIWSFRVRFSFVSIWKTMYWFLLYENVFCKCVLIASVGRCRKGIHCLIFFH